MQGPPRQLGESSQWEQRSASLGNPGATARGAPLILWLSPLDERLHCPEWLQPSERDALGDLPPQRSQEVLRSRVLLRRLAARVLGCVPQAVPLRADPGQPPRLQPAQGWHLSLSHSRGAALAAMARQPLGVDLEADNRPVAPALVRRFFSPQEARMLADLERERGPRWAQRQRLHCWLAKESLCKLLHQPLLPILKSWRYDPRGQALIHGGGQVIPCRIGSDGPWSWGCCAMAAARISFWTGAAPEPPCPV
ncbi:MAG: 4'-phosphopantetheinyl transferase superfamily protein [Synechococcus sp. SB0662_bin_45]|nr:4'-phosphopantetheinyl transferase superfamily protein [Synechococcus sp. SB0668_bin_13]MXX09706.1 4'-phosphopantetheinyl transferase superfamily protein [Synechococcus sp. SB0667_bin_8]MYE21372.1 4'-phosphopantetheinyl transferase superfamily protein [Synechococcus sp. SB0662_bin_45]MYG63230.1 4'-phosphopantetheinyl transferase superfamily protein [Synechococcus sp. SB0675_bin_7]MYI71940.1 4'-phosphopantetheinyl transferase superfamily protein [Synechococcus sp. SB0673_bin_10]MYK07945.1 4'